jgi:hypothetical protein
MHLVGPKGPTAYTKWVLLNGHWLPVSKASHSLSGHIGGSPLSICAASGRVQKLKGVAACVCENLRDETISEPFVKVAFQEVTGVDSNPP